MVKMNAINLKEFKEKKRQSNIDENYKRRYFAMSQIDHDLINLIHKKLEICKELNEFLGEDIEPMNFLTWLEIKHYERIHNYLNKGGNK